MTAPIFGLILAGGASTRMQRDKAALAYHGRSQVQWSFDLLSQVCAATFVSVRPDQREEPARASFPQVVDRQPGTGPIAGISAALLQHPKAAWLVVACDLPFLTLATLQHLIAHRDPQRIATAYRSSHDGLPEPLCAIWEPAAREPVLAYIASGKQCPRKFLINSDVLLLDLPDARALDNVNTREELAAATKLLQEGGGPPLRPHPVPPPLRRGGDANPHDHPHVSPRGDADAHDHPHLSPHGNAGTHDHPHLSPRGDAGPHERPHFSRHGGEGADLQGEPSSLVPPPQCGGGQGGGAPTGAGSKTVRIQYYAILREQAGRSEETLDTAAATPTALYEELRSRHRFQLLPANLKVAINSQFSDWRTPLQHGDTVVFIPPVAGG